MPLDTAAAAKQVVRDAMTGDETFDSLSEFGRNIVGSNSARLNIPLHDATQTIGALRLAIRDLTTLVTNVERMPDARSQLFTVAGTVRALNKRVNAYRQKGKSRF